MANFMPEGATSPAVVRLATTDDVRYLDRLQTRFSHQLGYLPLAALEKRASEGRIHLAFDNDQEAGYVLGSSPYKGRADVAVIYQAAIEYDARRRLIATLLVEAWAASLASSVRQVCLWCAQDIEANLFWQSLGFLPLAYRAGSVGKQRVHIFWQRHLGEDLDRSPAFVPEHTDGGLLKGPREVKLLEPGQDWQDRISVDWNALEATLHQVQAAAKVKQAERASRSTAHQAKRSAKAAEEHKARHEALNQVPAGYVRIVIGGTVRLVPCRRS